MRPAAALASDCCGLTDLARMCAVTGDDRSALVLTAGWSSRWMTTWKVAGREVTCPVAGMGGFPVPGCEPVRHFTWRTGQGHRPGLQSVTGTGRLHGFESHAEQCLLLALDFLGVLEVVSQPHRMRFESAAGPREHTPDFLAVTAEGTWLLDVRPADRIEAADRIEVRCLSRGSAGLRVAVWRGGRLAAARDDYPGHAVGAAADAERPLGLAGVLLTAAAGGPLRFADLVAATCYPAVARASRFT